MILVNIDTLHCDFKHSFSMEMEYGVIFHLLEIYINKPALDHNSSMLYVSQD